MLKNLTNKIMKPGESKTKDADAQAVQKSDEQNQNPTKDGQPEGIRVRVVGQPIGEPEGRFEKGQELTVSPDRRAALGDLVEEV
jgi:hypothetical protein